MSDVEDCSIAFVRINGQTIDGGSISTAVDRNATIQVPTAVSGLVLGPGHRQGAAIEIELTPNMSTRPGAAIGAPQASQRPAIVDGNGHGVVAVAGQGVVNVHLHGAPI